MTDATASHRPSSAPDEHSVDDEHITRKWLGETDDEQSGGDGGLHLRVGGEECAAARNATRRRARRSTTPSATPQPNHQRGRRPHAVDVPGAERLAGQRLGRDRERVEGEREEAPQRRRHLVGDQRHVAQARRHPHRRDQHRAQREGSHEERYAVARGSQHPTGVGAQGRCTCAAYRMRTVTRAARHAGLCDDGAQGRAGDPHAEAVDKQHVEGHIGRKTEDAGDQRGPRVPQAAQDPGRGEDDEHAGQSGGGDAQIGDRFVEGRWRGTERPAQGWRRRR